ncbi:MAG: ABC transporter ATP-binding protein [Rhodocyclaceae bacterium]|nr:ABC transporter ATP-binding protein [Rhodocyclaceae bacterium]
MSLLVLDAVRHAYGDHLVLEELSLTLQAGQIGCLLGASGCGKTTVLRLIAGFERPSAGSILLRDEVMASPRRFVPPEKRRIGMVFQDYALFPHLTVADNIAFGLRGMQKEFTRRRVRELLELVGLPAHGDRYPHELSGGQQQRIALARALAPAPHLLLLDEPFSNLDAELRERLSLEVRAILKETQTSAILVTHDQHEAFAMADVVGVMRAGRIEQWDTPYNLYHRPANRFVADFIGQGVFLPGRVLGAASVEIELGVLSCRLTAACAGEDLVDILLRPDDVIHDDASSRKATVVMKAFRGAEFLYTLRLPSGAHVLALVPSHHNHAIGEKIGIRLAVDHVVAFPHDPEASARAALPAAFLGAF